MVPLTGRKVAITGGAQGIGRSIAQALIAQGAKVVLGDLQVAAATQAAGQLGATAHRLDVADPASFAAFLDHAAHDLGGLDVLVNNAGIMPIGPFLAEDPALTRRTVDIDLMGVLLGTRLAGTRFAVRGSGHVVNIASVMGTLASPNAATYCAAKHAVVGFGAALRQEWRGSGVHVSTICPGFVRTELIAGMSAPGPLERFLVVDPEDVAAAVVKRLRKGSSGTVFVPKPVGWVSRGSAPLPAALVDKVFRLTGGHKVTAELNQQERAAYQARVEGRE